MRARARMCVWIDWYGIIFISLFVRTIRFFCGHLNYITNFFPLYFESNQRRMECYVWRLFIVYVFYAFLLFTNGKYRLAYSTKQPKDVCKKNDANACCKASTTFVSRNDWLLYRRNAILWFERWVRCVYTHCVYRHSAAQHASHNCESMKNILLGSQRKLVSLISKFSNLLERPNKILFWTR